MGKRRDRIQVIEDDKARRLTFNKRKHGLMKKAFELAALCNCQLALIIFDQQGRLYQFSSDSDIGGVVQRYQSYDGRPTDEKTSHDFQWLRDEYEGKTRKEDTIRRMSDSFQMTHSSGSIGSSASSSGDRQTPLQPTLPPYFHHNGNHSSGGPLSIYDLSSLLSSNEMPTLTENQSSISPMVLHTYPRYMSSIPSIDDRPLGSRSRQQSFSLHPATVQHFEHSIPYPLHINSLPISNGGGGHITSSLASAIYPMGHTISQPHPSPMSLEASTMEIGPYLPQDAQQHYYVRSPSPLSDYINPQACFAPPQSEQGHALFSTQVQRPSIPPSIAKGSALVHAMPLSSGNAAPVNVLTTFTTSIASPVESTTECISRSNSNGTPFSPQADS